MMRSAHIYDCGTLYVRQFLYDGEIATITFIDVTNIHDILLPKSGVKLHDIQIVCHANTIDPIILPFLMELEVEDQILSQLLEAAIKPQY